MARGRILIVDDDRDFAEGLADVLSPNGYEVEVATSGEEGLQRFRDDHFDVTFMDVRLHGESGVDVFLEIRRLKPDAQVIMMTGYSVEQILQQAIDQGALAALNKPLDPDKVLAMLREIMPAGILIADDDPDAVEGIQEILESQGYRVYVAHDGHEAVERIRNNGIDVLLLDLRMPILTGLEVYLELKRIGRVLPTIIVTAYAKEEASALDRLRLLSVEGILRKPFDPNELLELMKLLVPK